MEKRPAFRKYAGYFPAFMIKRPVKIDGMYYTYKDYPMLLMGNILIVAAMFFIYTYSPITPDPYGSQAIIFAVIPGVVLTAAYWLFYAYFFGRFQDDSKEKLAKYLPYLDNGEGQETREKKPKPTKQERVGARKSRGAFGAFVVLLCMLVTLYCTVLYTPVCAVIYKNDKQDLQKLADIACKYDIFYITRGDKPGETEIQGSTRNSPDMNQITVQEKTELAGIFNNLQKYSVFAVERWDFATSKTLVVYLIYKNNIYYIIYKETANQEQGASPWGDGLRLDDHWWRVD